MRSFHRILKNNILTISFLLISLFLVIAFFSNLTIRYLYWEKIWAHKVNTSEKLKNAKEHFPGIELDVMFMTKENDFDVNHPPDKSIGLSLSEYFKSNYTCSNLKYWIDFKNLSLENEYHSLYILDSLTSLHKIDKANIIVESGNPELLISFRNKGYLTSYYLPNGLHKLNNKMQKSEIEKIQQNLSSFSNNYISTDYKDYSLIKKHFNQTKLLIWFTHYSSVNKIKSRILLYQIVSDKNVDVLLLPYLKE